MTSSERSRDVAVMLIAKMITKTPDSTKYDAIQLFRYNVWRRGSPSLAFLEEHPCVLQSTINILINIHLLVSRLRLTCHATSPKLVLVWVRVGV